VFAACADAQDELDRRGIYDIDARRASSEPSCQFPGRRPARVLDTARRGSGDVVWFTPRYLTHPAGVPVWVKKDICSQEKKFVAEDFGVTRFDVMYNDFFSNTRPR